jgi:hypothetical protein
MDTLTSRRCRRPCGRFPRTTSPTHPTSRRRSPPRTGRRLLQPLEFAGQENRVAGPRSQERLRRRPVVKPEGPETTRGHVRVPPRPASNTRPLISKLVLNLWPDNGRASPQWPRGLATFRASGTRVEFQLPGLRDGQRRSCARSCRLVPTGFATPRAASPRQASRSRNPSLSR